MSGEQVGRLVGREDALARLSQAVDSTRQGAGGAILVTGTAGIGKTALLRTALGAAADVTVTWGTCVEGGISPGYWPWTQALNGLVRQVGVERARAVARENCGLLATLVPALGEQQPAEETERGRLLLLDATVAWVQALGSERPVLIVLDDLQWADDSSLSLLDFFVRSPVPAASCVLGAYRHDDLTGRSQRRLAALVGRVDHVHLTGLDRRAATRLAESAVGRPLPEDHLDAIFRRGGGHPFFTRELALAAADGLPADEVPAAVRDAVERRVHSFGATTREILRVAATISASLFTDVIAGVTGRPADEVAAAVSEATAAGMVVTSDEGVPRFAHDLFRETLAEGIELSTRPELHHAIGTSLESRAARTGGVTASEIARHFRASVGCGGLDKAVLWALRAADADRSSLALSEAADHLRRLRAAVADAGLALPDALAVEVLLAEADVLARNGRSPDARGLLRAARATAERAGDPRGSARTALAAAELGSRFAARRDDLIEELQTALAGVPDADAEMRARLTAALSRELAHSVAEQRHLAGPLSERALELGRTSGDPKVLHACLLARHDVLWTPGQAGSRSEVTAELVALSQRTGDRERQAEALLLHANVLLENGRAAFVATLEECLQLLESLGQPRHVYTAASRRACLALLRGRLDEAATGIEDTAVLGRRLREPDTGNVWMSQRLELVRARGVPEELTDYARLAVEHWTGAPVHAHAVAAGFCARAGDLAQARHHVAAVHDLGTWRADRSYLWSVFIRELAEAAVALQDRALCTELLAEVEPLAGTCAVNGALVAFAGCNSHTAGRLAAALGDRSRARRLLEDACMVYERLGAAFLEDARKDLDACLGASPTQEAVVALRHRGDVWHVTFAGRTASVRDCKGLHDIARLVQRPGSDIHALDLAASPVRSPAAGTIVDRSAAAQYRRRLTELAEARREAQEHDHAHRLLSIDEEYDALVTELHRGTTPGGRPRSFANHPAERARKAVTARIRDAVRRLDDALPELAAHLDQNLVTGVRCRYTGDRRWDVEVLS